MYYIPSETMTYLIDVMEAFPAATAQSEKQEHVFPHTLVSKCNLSGITHNLSACLCTSFLCYKIFSPSPHFTFFFLHSRPMDATTTTNFRYADVSTTKKMGPNDYHQTLLSHPTTSHKQNYFRHILFIPNASSIVTFRQVCRSAIQPLPSTPQELHSYIFGDSSKPTSRPFATAAN